MMTYPSDQIGGLFLNRSRESEQARPTYAPKNVTARRRSPKQALATAKGISHPSAAT
jgi:hypothetical protein